MSEKVKAGKAHGVEMCGEKLVLFRGKDGKVCSMPQIDLLQRQLSWSVLVSWLCSIVHEKYSLHVGHTGVHDKQVHGVSSCWCLYTGALPQ